MYTKVDKCRLCGNPNLTEVLDLGIQALTGVFPKSKGQSVTTGPLRLVKCMGADACNLLQLAHSYDPAEMYGQNYGYRSGLNPSMVAHLQGTVKRLLGVQPVRPDSVIIDIGSNDSTTLQAYPVNGCTLVGVDPTGVKFRSFYPPHITLVPEFFPSETLRRLMGGRKATIITSFSMLYDLESPLQFARSVADMLDDEGIWVFEQSYMPTMLSRNSYDTVCHEHLEYYALRQIQWLADQANLRLIDVEFNDVNGGSFCVTAAKRQSTRTPSEEVECVLQRERELGLDGLLPYQEFATRVAQNRQSLRDFLDKARRDGKVVGGIGASTKGNVILQYCNITPEDIAWIGEVNEDKLGCYTPGSLIPIVSEAEVMASRPDYLLVLPWHFRTFFAGRFPGQNVVFPLPVLEVAER
jgi:C-methyltransferase C-terminal domain/Putative zinc binding domain/Methyltransferase domain